MRGDAEHFVLPALEMPVTAGRDVANRWPHHIVRAFGNISWLHADMMARATALFNANELLYVD
jgi:hypothetical protein